MPPNPDPAPTRDIIVIGSSAGGVEALQRILQQLPADLGASVAVVQHLAATRDPLLVGLLRRSTALTVGWAEQGESIRHGRVYVAPPDLHLLFTNGHLHLTRTARESHARPSIDKLFRSAAAVHGSRVIAVLLTGMLDDGVAGLRAIHDAGGVVIVQDPQDAAFPDLPARALLVVPVDETLPLDRIGAALLRIVGTPVATVPPPPDIVIEAEYDRMDAVTPAMMQALGPQSSVMCPECSGPLWQLGNEGARRYRCYNGHVTSARRLLEDSSAHVDAALWSAVRALNDRATTLETLATDSRRIGSLQSAEEYAVRAREAREQVELARRFMLDLARTR